MPFLVDVILFRLFRSWKLLREPQETGNGCQAQKKSGLFSHCAERIRDNRIFIRQRCLKQAAVLSEPLLFPSQSPGQPFRTARSGIAVMEDRKLQAGSLSRGERAPMRFVKHLRIAWNSHVDRPAVDAGLYRECESVPLDGVDLPDLRQRGLRQRRNPRTAGSTSGDG